MTTSPSRKDLSHDRIVEVAARAIRRAGYQGVGVADLMKEAGLTHGGFYAHFANRDALLVEAMDRAARDSAAAIAERIAHRRARGASPLRALVESYLSDTHLAATERGCPIAALGSEMARQAPEVLEMARTKLRGLQARVKDALPPDAPAENAALLTSSLVGALQLARALGDNAQGRAHLAACRQALLAQFDTAAAAPAPRSS